ncbi:non-canonical purine NTP pyrophosphatase [Nannocystis sp.]|uniref:non-canonical purine NTP pyrophosphatase n=1 Tax=Nannocystis sp. TaxID=1962667 RepID=UPI0026012E98|nr:non-canonical purine NTP pyrophosphatase [Nannocystis sp.]
MILYFSSSNERKHEDLARFFHDSPHPPKSLRQTVPELLSYDLEEIVREKAMAAYRRVAAPLFVEHGGLYVDALGGLPGPLARLFCERLTLVEFCNLIGPGASRRAEVRQLVCLCDGKSLRLFEGNIRGTIAAAPRGDGGIHWAPLFIPDGATETMGEMPHERRLAAYGDPGAFGKLRRALGL